VVTRASERTARRAQGVTPQASAAAGDVRWYVDATTRPSAELAADDESVLGGGMANRSWRIRLARASLALAALAFLGFGLLFLLRPESIQSMGVLLESATARTEIRGFYGGLEVGLGLFFFVSLLRVAWFRPALLAQAATLSGIALGRIVGIVVEGSGEVLIWFYASVEIAGALLGLVAYVAMIGVESKETSESPNTAETR
jgi:hypothetical protein